MCLLALLVLALGYLAMRGMTVCSASTTSVKLDITIVMTNLRIANANYRGCCCCCDCRWLRWLRWFRRVQRLVQPAYTLICTFIHACMQPKTQTPRKASIHVSRRGSVSIRHMDGVHACAFGKFKRQEPSCHLAPQRSTVEPSRPTFSPKANPA